MRYESTIDRLGGSRCGVDVPITVEVLLAARDWAESLRADALAGLCRRPRQLPPTYFYDDLGCALFDAITRLPEYYPTRTERAILSDCSPELAAITGADTLVELGAGTAEKTRVVLDAMAAAGSLRQYVPFDVAEATLRRTADAIAAEYPGVGVYGVVGDLRRHLGRLPRGGRRLIAFLGGTVGNFDRAQRSALLAAVAATMAPGDALLLGTDLVKDRRRLVAAYDDAAGVTAAFNRNVLQVINRDLGADFDPEAFEHVARFDEPTSCIEMHLRSTRDQTVTLPTIGTTLSFSAGETIRTEISAKFGPSQAATELMAAGLTPRCRWTDPAGDYALTLGIR